MQLNFKIIGDVSLLHINIGIVIIFLLYRAVLLGAYLDVPQKIQQQRKENEKDKLNDNSYKRSHRISDLTNSRVERNRKTSSRLERKKKL